MFRATHTTKRFNVNQRVWVRYDLGNSLKVWFKFRGSGRYVSGRVDRFATCVGEIKTVEVDDAFAARIVGEEA